MKLRIALLALFAILTSSCGITSYSPKDEFKIFKPTSIQNYEIIQTFNEGFGLAMSRDNFMAIAIKSSRDLLPMYDGEIIRGRFIMIDTYTYDTRPDEQGRQTRKTVPLVVPWKEFQDLLKEDSEDKLK